MLETTPCDRGSGCTEEGSCEPLPASCAAVLAADPNAPDGAFLVDVDGAGALEPFEVLCDMTTGGGGWTLVALNDAPTTFVDFNQDWATYKAGFGDLAGGARGWLGNDRLNALTAAGLELEVRHDTGTSIYADFSVGSEASDYQLTVSSTPNSNDAGRFESFHSGLRFSTFDEENDTHDSRNCADFFRAGWWYGDCFAMSIASGTSDQGAYWRQPNDLALFVDYIELWVR